MIKGAFEMAECEKKVLYQPAAVIEAAQPASAAAPVVFIQFTI